MNRTGIGSKIIAAGAVLVVVAGGATAATGGPLHHKKKTVVKQPTVYIAQYSEDRGGKQPPIGSESGTYLTLPVGTYLMRYDISVLSTDSTAESLDCDPVYDDKGMGGGGNPIDLYTRDGGAGQAITGDSTSSSEIWRATSTTKVRIDCDAGDGLLQPGLSIDEFTVTAVPIGTLHAKGAAAS